MTALDEFLFVRGERDDYRIRALAAEARAEASAREVERLNTAIRGLHEARRQWIVNSWVEIDAAAWSAFVHELGLTP